MTVSPPVRAWVPWLILISGLFVTSAGSIYVAESGRTRDQIKFDNAGQEIINRLSARVETAVTLLRAGAAVMAAKDGVTRDQFVHFVQHLELKRRFAFVEGIGYAEHISSGDIQALQARMCAEGAKNFAVWSAGAPTTDRSIVLYFEPPGPGSTKILGFDMASEPVRRAAMDAAAVQGRPVASGKASFVLDPKDPPPEAAFLVFVPVYRGGFPPVDARDRAAALSGFIYSPFRAKALLGTLLDSQERRQFVVQVYDGDKRTDSALLYDSAHGQAVELLARFTVPIPVIIQQRHWVVVLAARPEFMSTSPALVPVLFGIGVGLSVLLFQLTRAEARARDAAERAAIDLRESEETVQSASRAKDEFLATLSHELRTPLNAILGWTRMLRTGQLDASRADGALEVIERSARSLAQLVEDLLDVSRVITGNLRLDLRAVPINPAVEHAIDTARPAADAKGVAVSWMPDPHAGTIVAAPERLQQILWNLLSNAIKFTPSGGQIELTTRRRTSDVEIVVRDTGVGISPAFLPHVFERFRQADSSSTRSHAGVGLGLAIVRHLVELHGGTIEAASDGLGKGAAFTVRFPLRSAALADQLESAATARSEGTRSVQPRLSGLRILVVDDEESARGLVRAVLEREQAEVQEAGSAAEALSSVETHVIDIVISDLAMPGEDGFDLVRQIRARELPRFRSLPIIALTAYARVDDRERVMAAGFQGYLPKPVNLDQLVALVAQLTGRTL
jgi:signal transduction histidine kinase/ActR/RegA family two-component response regulator